MGRIAHMTLTASEFLGSDAGRIAAASPWRAGPFVDSDHDYTLRALVREAQEYGADSVADIAFDVERCAGGVCEGVMLQRLVATGRAVRRALG